MVITEAILVVKEVSEGAWQVAKSGEKVLLGGRKGSAYIRAFYLPD